MFKLQFLKILMNSTSSDNTISRDFLQKQIALFAYWVVCMRGYFNIFIENSLPITIFLNVVIILAIILGKLKKILFVIFGLSLLTIYNKDALALIDIFAMTYILKGVNLKKIAIINIICFFAFFVVWQYALYTGKIVDVTELGHKGLAHHMGFDNTNVLGMVGFTLLCSLYLTCKSALSKTILFFSIPVVNQIFYEYSLSRTPWISGYVLMLCMALQFVKLFRPCLKKIIGLLPLLIVFLIIYAAFNFNALSELNSLTTGRVRYAGLLLMRMTGLNLLIGMPVPDDLIIDNSYIMLLCDGGIVCLSLFIVVFYKGITNYWNEIRSYIPYIIAIITAGLTENTFASVSGLSVVFWYLILNGDPYSRHSLKNPLNQFKII